MYKGVYMYEGVFIYIYIYIYICMYIYICICTHAHTHKHVQGCYQDRHEHTHHARSPSSDHFSVGKVVEGEKRRSTVKAGPGREERKAIFKLLADSSQH
jgi:hypothetical protein